MAKLVGVVHDKEQDPSSPTWNSRCLARRQLPLTIEPELTMIMALDDACLACSSSTLHEISDHDEINISMQTFIRKYDALSRDEVTAALMVNFGDIMATLSNEVSCVGCRRSVENMLLKLYSSGDPALDPLVITEDKVVSVGRDHITTPKALANLFCNQLHRLRTTYIDPITGSKSRKKNVNYRCNTHSTGLSKKLLTVGHWISTWKCMERECQEECVLIHFERLRETIERYLKNYSFCDECSQMVWKAYNLLVIDSNPEEEEEGDGDHEVTSSCCKAPISSKSEMDSKNISLIYNGLTSCVGDQHVHVECKEEVVAHLIELADTELSDSRKVRHAKTIEIAQKEVLACIGICLYERFKRIQIRLCEGQQACDLLFFVALQSLKHSFEMAFESKQGISDLEKLCQEFDEEDRKKQEKALKKREKKSKKKAAAVASKKETNCSTKNLMPAEVSIMKKLEEQNSSSPLFAKSGEDDKPMSVIKLASMLDHEDAEEEADAGIPQEEIQQYLQQVSEQREELRKNLRQRFAQLCVNGL